MKSTKKYFFNVRNRLIASCTRDLLKGSRAKPQFNKHASSSVVGLEHEEQLCGGDK